MHDSILYAMEGDEQESSLISKQHPSSSLHFTVLFSLPPFRAPRRKQGLISDQGLFSRRFSCSLARSVEGQIAHLGKTLQSWPGGGGVKRSIGREGGDTSDRTASPKYIGAAAAALRARGSDNEGGRERGREGIAFSATTLHRDASRGGIFAPDVWMRFLGEIRPLNPSYI